MKAFLLKINQVVLVIILAEFLLFTAFGFLAPILAIFVTGQIAGGTVAVVGFALMIYWSVKSILQLFIARYIDRNHGEIDDFYFFISGVFANAILVSLYYFASSVWHIYALHFLIGVADAMLVPPLYAIFTRHIDKNQEGFEWSLFSSFSLGAGSALGGAIGGLLGAVIGFRAVFLVAGILTLISGITLLFLRPFIKPRVLGETASVFMDGKRM